MAPIGVPNGLASREVGGMLAQQILKIDIVKVYYTLIPCSLSIYQLVLIL